MKTTRSGTRAGRKRKCAEHREFTEKSIGFVGESAPCYGPGNEAGEVAKRREEPAPAAWMTPDLIERTHEVWSENYGRSLERWEVLEILRNVRWFGEVLRRGLTGGTTT